ncbi:MULTISPECIES: TetR/AcrR family transcriptional regulator C-terminal domain-containing protein [Stenotrophomonas]|uniref:TetR/AcrR family transcriptional regulator C-terminal domain-containing protein n=1 Tax=Stenotrophomonas TaxID=40323 RepID=UPI00163A7ABB|nr:MULTISPECIES: TetR/AcrR family transcriptional regulator C-terminal domain-containing protein [Stenotrophomonas]MDQ1061266.1 hypothetical protein [Stenotrophomonas sp. SORGH_AS_0282]MDQ1190385.1 hypothetical protein [Stenotrophomonas sp. SORGH_AS_0282]
MYKPSPSPAVAISGYQKAILERLTEALQTGDASLSDPGSVAEAVGISRKEISAAFGCEGGMVLALAGHYASFLVAPLRACATAADMKVVLREFASRFVAANTGGALAQLYRLGLGESARSRESGNLFFQAGPAAVNEALGRFLRLAQDAGVVEPTDEREMASHLLALLRGGWHVADMLGWPCPERSDDDRVDIRRIVDLFCAGVCQEAPHAYAAA